MNQKVVTQNMIELTGYKYFKTVTLATVFLKTQNFNATLQKK